MSAGVELIFVFSLVLFSTVNAHSTEGFSEVSTPVPSEITNVWNATVRVNATQIKNLNSHSQTAGTGIVISYNSSTREGIIVTNGHVAGCQHAKACNYQITFQTTELQKSLSTTAKLVGEYPHLDLAYLKFIAPKKIEPTVAEFDNNARDIAINSDVVAIGYPDLPTRSKEVWKSGRPEGFRKKIKRYSTGQALGIRKNLINDRYPYTPDLAAYVNFPYVIKHNADTLKGNSGGPLIELATGKVIGINSGIIESPDGSPHCESQNNHSTPGCVYFSIPSDVVLSKLPVL